MTPLHRTSVLSVFSMAVASAFLLVAASLDAEPASEQAQKLTASAFGIRRRSRIETSWPII